MSVFVKDVVKKFNLKVIMNQKYLINKIYVKEVNIASLELAGFYLSDKNKKQIDKRALVFGDKEKEFIKTLNRENKITNYKKLFSKYEIPAIFTLGSFSDKDLQDVLKKYKIPLIKVDNINKYEFISLYVEYLSTFLSRNVVYHGSFINIYGYGTLIIGESGIGKSEAVLDLVKKKHLFVGDDSIALTRTNNKIIGRATEIIKNYLEIRGIGIVNLPKLYGAQIILDESYLNLVIELVHVNSKKPNIDRLGDKYLSIKIHNIDIPKIQIPVITGRNISDIIETAVAKFKSDIILGSSFKEFEERYKKLVGRNDSKSK